MVYITPENANNWWNYISRNSNGRCTCLLTSITSKKVWIHLLYAPLTHSIVVLGSMGTGEDLFYKCCAHSEELSTHKQYPEEISPWNLANWLWVFISWRKTIHTIFTYWLILSHDLIRWIKCSYENQYIKQGYFAFFLCLVINQCWLSITNFDILQKVYYHLSTGTIMKYNIEIDAESNNKKIYGTTPLKYLHSIFLRKENIR